MPLIDGRMEIIMKKGRYFLAVSVLGFLLSGCLAVEDKKVTSENSNITETSEMTETTEDTDILRKKYGDYWNANYICADDTFIAYLTEDQRVYVCMGYEGQVLDAPAGASSLLYIGDARLLIFYPDRETLAYSLWNDNHEFSVTALDKSVWNGECQTESQGACQIFEYEKSLVNLKNVKELWTRSYEMIARMSDGTISSHMIDVPMEQWNELTEIQSYNSGIIGLRHDGTVLWQEKETDEVIQENKYDVSDWKNIIDLEGGIFGLKRDGTIVCSIASDTAISDWKDICQISYYNYLAALRWDGTVFAVWNWNNSDLLMIDMEDWKGIQAIKVWYGGLIGITEEGNVLATNFINGERVERSLPKNAPKAYVPEKPYEGF